MKMKPAYMMSGNVQNVIDSTMLVESPVWSAIIVSQWRSLLLIQGCILGRLLK